MKHTSEQELLVRRPRPGGTRGSAVVGSALAVALVVVGTTVLQTHGASDGGRGPVRLENGIVQGGVDNTFSCPHRSSFDASRASPAAFAPSLADGPRAVAQRFSAPRYEYVETGSKALLRLGNADGSLGSVTEFTRAGPGTPPAWQLGLVQRCAGPDGSGAVPVDDQWRLGRHGEDPWQGPEMLRGVPGVRHEPVLVDDRQFYDAAGLLEQRSMYAVPCQDGVCVAAGAPGTMVLGANGGRDGRRPREISDLFVPRDAQRTNNPFRVWRLWADDDVTGLQAVTRARKVVRAARFRGVGWSRTLFVLLARAGEVLGVRVNTAAGSHVYAPDELPGYEP